MRVVLALGGNALLKRGEPLELDFQRRNVARAAGAIAPIIRQHDVVITHGNGPQIGLLALQSAAYREVSSYSLDVLGAESEGMVGYLLEMALQTVLPGREFATLLTQVEVDPDDPACATPSKPIGPIYNETESRKLTHDLGWIMMPDGAGWRRAVPSPEPKRIREVNAIRTLLLSNVVTICAGGGGVPVKVTAAEEASGVEAVVDKDLTAALLAQSLDADVLLLLTDVEAVWTDWPPERGHPIGRTTPTQLRRLSFARGSMGPKVEAACRFVEATARIAGIGAIEAAPAILSGQAGTIISA